MENGKLEKAVCWFAVEATVLTLSGLAFWEATMAQEGNVEGMFPWQLLKLCRLLLTSSAWLAVVGLAIPVSCLLRGRSGGSKNSN
jgi:hypothetical protein